MLSIQQDPSGCRRRDTQDTTDLGIQREANGWDVSPADREIVAQAMQILGRETTARRLRETNSRRRRPALSAVPDDSRRPLKSRPDRPILIGLNGGGQATHEEHGDEAASRAVLERGLLAALEVPGVSLHLRHVLRLAARDFQVGSGERRDPPA
jgi:hypothetical protein